MDQQTDITFPAADGRPTRGFLALPNHPGPAPAVLVIHEILGLNDDIRRIAARFADAGYVTFAPDVYDGPGPRAFCVVRALLTLRRHGGSVADDLMAARTWLADRPDVDAARIGVAGFCMGGGFALLLGVREGFAAAAPFYGEVPAARDRLRGICPVVGGWGARDRLFGPHGARLRDHLNALGVEHDVVVYEAAGHSYMSHHEPGPMRWLGERGPLLVGYDESAAEDSWRRMLAFFSRHLGGPPPENP